MIEGLTLSTAIGIALGVAFALVVRARLLKKQPPPRPIWWAVVLGIGIPLLVLGVLDALVRR